MLKEFKIKNTVRRENKKIMKYLKSIGFVEDESNFLFYNRVMPNGYRVQRLLYFMVELPNKDAAFYLVIQRGVNYGIMENLFKGYFNKAKELEFIINSLEEEFEFKHKLYEQRG